MQVGKITSRMGEVDENLNYLLGRLSLVMQEFNQVKSGLGNALDTIRSSFHEVQSKLKGRTRIFIALHLLCVYSVNNILYHRNYATAIVLADCDFSVNETQ